ncbi:MAG TPA: alpha/beta hydrolase, partial [Opitutae bacterium]|nr:alpha/beta hydrolase [Opitutae bacterium]
MPGLSSAYRAPFLLRNAHVQTVLPSIMRRKLSVPYVRERLELDDGDFIDLDWLRSGASELVVLCHGLESSTRATYMQGMARVFYRAGLDVCAMNMRGCSGEENRLPRSYHSGATEDLQALLEHAAGLDRYQSVVLIGFSLGGNLILKYLGEGRATPLPVGSAVAISVPCDLASSARRLESRDCQFYMRRFARELEAKYARKVARFPEHFEAWPRGIVRSFSQFDAWYTAPAHGFCSAEDYWEKSSARGYLGGIEVPTLLINALDDPFLSEDCYPEVEAKKSRYLYLEMPASGGHVGFVTLGKQQGYWHEQRSL